MNDYLKVNEDVYNKLSDEYKKRKKYYIDTDKDIIKFFMTYLKKNFNNAKIIDIGSGSGLDLFSV